MAFANFIRFLTDGLVKNERFLTSFKIPDRSYFFLKRRIARSIGSFSPIMMPTKKFTSSGFLRDLCCWLWTQFFNSFRDNIFNEFSFTIFLKRYDD